MRNLKVTSCRVLPAEELLAHAQCFCLDTDLGTVWVATKSELCCIEDTKVCSMAVLSGHFASCDDHVIGMEYVTDVESVCLALSGGNILLYNITNCELESVGEIEVGVVSMGWSPEQDLVVIVTAESNLILMTKDFDPLVEKALHQEDFGQAKFVNVGWGKKATQFHGSEGKPKAEQLQEKVAKPGVPWDDGKVRISWRGDGEYFACSVVDPATRARVIRIWSREGVHLSTSETIEGLEHTLAWKPSGNLMASTQLKPNRSDVIFLEKNGLQHGEFPFMTPPSDVHVKELLWSADSAVLCVWCVRREREEGREAEEWVQLWTTGNYHWYLKQEIRLAKNQSSSDGDGDGGNGALVGLVWDPIVPLRLHLLRTDGQYLCYTWHWCISESKFCSKLNHSGVCVIDGAQILYTAFRFGIVPPPISARKLATPTAVSEVVFSPPPHSNDFLVVLSDFRVAVCTVPPPLPMEDVKDGERPVLPQPDPQLVGITSVGELMNCFHSLRQFVWWSEACLLAVAMSNQELSEGVYRESLVQFSLEIDREKKSVKITECFSVVTPGPVVCLHGNPNTGTAVIQLTSGEVMKISTLESGSGCGLSPWCCVGSGSHLRYEPQVRCEKMELAVFNGKERVVGLCEGRNLLYVDDLRVETGCMSFVVHDEFLLITTVKHVCRCISLHSEPKALEPLGENPFKENDESVRRVERGSRIVTAIPSDVTLLLQMPRGNLEAISPRALVLSNIRKSLDSLDFGAAYRCSRKHRVNLNLLFDHNPKAFLDNVSKFVEQVKSVDYLNIFLTELVNDDVSKTLYPIPQSVTATPTGAGGSGTMDERLRGSPCKVDLVCESVREALMAAGENKYLLSIITSYVKMSSPQLETVLNIIQRLKVTQASRQSSDKQEDVVSAEKALKYSLFLVDVNKMYDVALGMYDLPLAVMVAEKSQMDPKEFLPFLNGLRRLPLHYQRYKLDSHLKRYEKALHHIAKCGPEKFEECMSLIETHSLYKAALKIFNDQKSSEYKKIARKYGQHLMQTSRHSEAGIIFSQCGCYQEAFGAFEKAGSWELMFVTSSLLQHSPAQRMEAARRMATSLRSSRRFAESGRVFVDYAEDIEEGVVSLLEGSLWAESLRLLHLHQRHDLIQTHLLPGLVEAQESRLSLFEKLHADFSRHSARLVVVRETKRQKQAAILDGTYATDERDADLFSDTSSITGRSAISSINTSLTSYSKTSGRSSKTRRKAERKKMSLREGSAHEEEALVAALKEIVTSVDGLQDDVQRLLPALVQFGFNQEADTVQNRFGELLDTVRGNMEEVWPSDAAGLNATNIQTSMGPDATVNSILAAMAAKQDQRTASTTTTSAAAGPPPPVLRDNVKWKLSLL